MHTNCSFKNKQRRIDLICLTTPQENRKHNKRIKVVRTNRVRRILVEDCSSTGVLAPITSDSSNGSNSSNPGNVDYAESVQWDTVDMTVCQSIRD